MPGFSSEGVLRILEKMRPDVPCIIVSGRIGEEAAVAAMRAGAAGYVGKDHLQQLDTAISRALREAEDRRGRSMAEGQLRLLEQAVQDLAEGIVIAEADSGKIVFVNRGWYRMTGYAPEEIEGRPSAELGPPWTDKERLCRLCANPPVDINAQGVATTRRKDGTEYVLEWQVAPVRDASGRATHLVSVQRDVTERIRSEEALRVSEERYKVAVEGSNDGVWDWDLRSGKVYFSTRWRAMLGYGEGELEDSPEEWLRRIHPQDAMRVRAEIDVHLDGATPHFESEHRVLHREGTWRWMLVRGLAVRDASGRATRIAGSMTDITQHKEAEEQLAHGALHDALTGLPNRVLLMDRLWHSLGRVRRYPRSLLAVLFIDLDRFKVINDSLGHGVGDRLLVHVARLLETCLRPGDTVARLGGDEFAMVLDDLRDSGEATRIATRIQKELQKPIAIEGREVFTTASIGIALAGGGAVAGAGTRPEELLRDADTAMYRAKALGKSRHIVFDSAMHDRAVALLQLETDLRRSVERNDFRVLYQPVVSLDSGRIEGFEALVRWQHPTRGLVMPSEFVPLAEETGLILHIGRWVLRQACTQMRRWLDLHRPRRPLSIGVNLSGRQFSQADLLDQIGEVLSDTGLSPESLHLEITETVLIENADLAAAMLAKLRAMDVRVSLDDFGTGYSSLSYLHRFKVDMLKIDKSFVDRMGAHGENVEIVGTIAALANNLGMSVIAEGVESVEQARLLWELKCSQAQGYLFSAPIEASQADRLLADDRRWEVHAREPAIAE
jgi:diguanylate cyclase (GGDEF)-like protein/PAS domain S-box-containing protein